MNNIPKVGQYVSVKLDKHPRFTCVFLHIHDLITTPDGPAFGGQFIATTNEEKVLVDCWGHIPKAYFETHSHSTLTKDQFDAIKNTHKTQA